MYWQELSRLELLLQKNRLGLISDFDGTLSPIVAQSSAAQLAEGNRELLHQLHQQLSLVALISGRAVADLRQRVGLPELTYIGNHGLEYWRDEQVVYSPEVMQFRPELETVRDAIQLERLMQLEDKIATLSIHYRQTENPAAIEQTYAPALQALAETHGLKFSQGRMVFEIRPPLEINKGTALAGLVHEHQLDGLIFIGDDVTDADAMRVARELQAQGICETVNLGVESPEITEVIRAHADALATGVSDVSAFLAWLVSASSI